MILLYRHAHAGSRARWQGDDRLRPLSVRGRRQAEQMARTLADLGVAKVESSPYLRCVQTVEPLAALAGLGIAQTEGLAEGAGPARVLRLVDQGGDENVILCTHGDVVLESLAAMERAGGRFEGDPTRQEKGSVWLITPGPRSRLRYLPPPQS